MPGDLKGYKRGRAKSVTRKMIEQANPPDDEIIREIELAELDTCTIELDSGHFYDYYE